MSPPRTISIAGFGPHNTSPAIFDFHLVASLVTANFKNGSCIPQPYSPTFGRTEMRPSYQRTCKEQELYRYRPTYPRRRRRHLCRPANALSQCGVGQGSQVPSVRIGLLIIVCMITGAEPRPFLLTLAPHGACRCHPALHSAYVLTVRGS